MVAIELQYTTTTVENQCNSIETNRVTLKEKMQRRSRTELLTQDSLLREFLCLTQQSIHWCFCQYDSGFGEQPVWI